MALRKEENYNLQFGLKLKELRENLMDASKSRQEFIDRASEDFFNGQDWISLKSLTNYEAGKNIPNLVTSKKLAIALQIEFAEFIRHVEDLI